MLVAYHTQQAELVDRCTCVRTRAFSSSQCE